MLYLLFNHHFYIYIKVSAMEQPLGAQKKQKTTQKPFMQE